MNDARLGVARVDALDHEGRGVAHVDGKAVFIDGALVGETVHYVSFRKKPQFELAQLVHVDRPSALRTNPRCPHFGVCGGCSLQHLEASAQVAVKQRHLEDSLARIGKVTPGRIEAPIYGPSWGYRHRARLAVRYVAKKGGVLVGFHEKRSSYVADMTSCAVLPPALSALLVDLRRCFAGLSVRERLPQLEVAVGERVIALVLRLLEPLSLDDETRLRRFVDHYAQGRGANDLPLCWYIQRHGPASIERWYPLDAPPLDYRLSEFVGGDGQAPLTFAFSPGEFTQVNFAVNARMIQRAMSWLAPAPGERIADLFCGIGNFTLPIRSRGAQVVGFEGSAALVNRAGEVAMANGFALGDTIDYVAVNLFAIDGRSLATYGTFDKWLIDPPREGAIELIKALGEGETPLPQRIVYVSCHPATLARDAAVLVHVLGYECRQVAVLNMFPQTSHVESMALFELSQPDRGENA